MKLTQIDRKDIVAALQSGKATTAELSSTYGVTSGRVAVVYREETGLKLTPFKRLSQREKEAIVAELLAEKVKVGELAARYGVTPSAISYVYKKKVGKPHRPYPRWKLSNQEKETIVAELVAKKATIEELAHRFGVPHYIISNLFRKHTGKSFGAPNVSSKVKETIVKEVQSNEDVTMRGLADKYGIHIATLERIIKQGTGKTFRSLRPQQTLHISLTTERNSIKATKAQRKSDYRAWHKEEKKLYPVLGIDWFYSRVLIERPQELVWLDMSFFMLSRKTPMRDRSRTPEHPKGKIIYEGDIVEFPILLRGNDGKSKKTMVKGTVTYDGE